MRESGGDIEVLLEGAFLNAVLLPGGKALVGCLLNASTIDVVAIDLASSDTVHVVSGVCPPRWSPTGHLLVPNQDGTLRALPFDPERLRVTGPSTPVLSGIQVRGGQAEFHVSRTGTLLYVAGPSTTGTSGLQLTMVGMDGSVSPIPLPPTDHPDAGFSPDGKTLAYTREGQIWLYDMDLGTHRQFTRVGSEHHNPVWSPDGTRLAYRALRAEGNGGDVYVQALSGDTVGTHIGGTPGGDDPTQWLPDGRILEHQDAPSDIVTLNADQPGAPVPILQADWNEMRARVSPDGTWLAYQSNEAGRNQLLVRTWPGLDRKSVIADSVAGSLHFWSNDNRTLYYVRQGRLMAASLAGTDSLRPESHRVAIESLGGTIAAMHPDGRRFLVFRRAGAQTTGPAARRSLVVVTGWLTALRQRLAEGAAR
jgi:dipeptidyl aminopeptidase/acylaminoacyl peptidase